MRAVLLCMSLMAGALTAPAYAQGRDLNTGVVQSQILVIDFEKVFAQSVFGRQLNAEVEREGAAIVAENRRIEAELIEEEQRLTEQRANMPVEDFRALADAFDEKVQRLRSEQDTKAEALTNRTEESRRAFLQVARPVLEGLMRESNAAVVLERRSVLVASDAVDITAITIKRIDAQFDLDQLPVHVPEALPDESATAPDRATPSGD